MAMRAPSASIKPKFPRRSKTWQKEHSIPDVIASFMNWWNRSHYEALARRANELVKDKLKKADVHASTQFRAKSEERLREKLCRRYLQKHYIEERDILDDIVDLAGVRIVLYTTTKDQYAKVTEVIQEIWGKVEPIQHPQEEERKPPCAKYCETCEYCTRERERQERSQRDGSAHSEDEAYQPIHLGYKATHFRCPMTIDHVSEHEDGYFWKNGDRVEIQVVSALVHSWAEVGHDVLYKGHTFGKATPQEQLILDALNGLIHSGDLLLQQFQELVEERTYKRFTYPDDLRSCLRKMDIIHSPDTQPECEGEALELLFKFIMKEEKHNYPLAVRKAFLEFKLPEENTMQNFVDEEFRPPFQPADNMLASICLIHVMLWKGETGTGEMEYSKSYLPAKRCQIMMKALILLQSFFGEAEKARTYLKRVINDEKNELSIDYLLTQAIFLQEALDEKDSFYTKRQEELRPQTSAAWNWFVDQSRYSSSICGLAFRLAEMGAVECDEVMVLLEKLTIAPLSRSSTGSTGD